MDIENITEDFVETLDILKSVGCIYLDKGSKMLTFVGDNTIKLDHPDFKKICSQYKRYFRFWQAGGCKPCRETKMANIAREFDLLVKELKIKYLGDM